MATYYLDWTLVQTFDDLKAVAQTFMPSSVVAANSGELEQHYPLILDMLVEVPPPPVPVNDQPLTPLVPVPPNP